MYNKRNCDCRVHAKHIDEQYAVCCCWVCCCKECESVSACIYAPCERSVIFRFTYDLLKLRDCSAEICCDCNIESDFCKQLYVFCYCPNRNKYKTCNHAIDFKCIKLEYICVFVEHCKNNKQRVYKIKHNRPKTPLGTNWLIRQHDTQSNNSPDKPRRKFWLDFALNYSCCIGNITPKN